MLAFHLHPSYSIQNHFSFVVSHPQLVHDFSQRLVPKNSRGFLLKVNHLRASFLKYSLICICLERMRQTTITTKAGIRMQFFELHLATDNQENDDFEATPAFCMVMNTQQLLAKQKGALRPSDLNPSGSFQPVKTLSQSCRCSGVRSVSSVSRYFSRNFFTWKVKIELQICVD